MAFVDDLIYYFRAGYPAVWVETFEEDRCAVDIFKAAGQLGMGCLKWRMTRGWTSMSPHGEGGTVEQVYIATEALNSVANMAENTVYVFLNFHFFLDAPDVIQTLKDLIPVAKATSRHLVFISARVNLPPELEKDIVVLDYPLPDKEDLGLVLREVAGVAGVEIEAGEKLVEAALGLTVQEAENAFSLAVVKHKSLSVEAVETVMNEKVAAVRKSKLLEFYPAEEGGLSAIGGLEELKKWLSVRQKAFGEKARAAGIDPPKGVLLAGVPGTGKTLTAKAVAKAWGWPLLRFDVGRVFGSLVGESEARMRQALRLAEAVAPVVLVIDEMEKGIAGLGSSGMTDSGVTARVVGELLTWMNDKTAPVFVVATVNRVEALPPELLRKGRFDEVFFVDLPDEEERREIFRIHLTKRNIDVWNEEFIAASRGFSGAEIERAVQEAKLVAFAEERQVTAADILKELTNTTPLSTTMREEVERLRQWAKDRARPASRRKEEAACGRRVKV